MMLSSRRKLSPDDHANDSPSVSLSVKGCGSNSSFRILLLTAAFAMIAILRPANRVFQKNNELIGKNDVKEVTTTSSSKSNDLALQTERWKQAKEVRRGERIAEHVHENLPSIIDENIDPSNIPIYLSDSNASIASIDYRFLAVSWDRKTTYEDLFAQAQNTPYKYTTNPPLSSAKSALRSSLRGHNITVIHHTSPKTASSTIRKACMDTQYDTCNLPRKPENMKWPEGYRTPKRLTQLFGECPDTKHFCVRYTPLTRNYTTFYDTRTFLHLFPFRNYDEWAVSALHQISYRDGEKGCEEMDGLLDQCLPHKYELDFDKYTKSILAEFILSFKRVHKFHPGMKVKDHHHILLYNYQLLDETLTWLSGDDFGVPSLPGTNQSINSERPVGPCKEEAKMMKKYHDCFSEKLGGVH